MVEGLRTEELPGGPRYLLPRRSLLRRIGAAFGYGFVTALLQTLFWGGFWFMTVALTRNDLRGAAGCLVVLIGGVVFFLSLLPAWMGVLDLWGRPAIGFRRERVWVGRRLFGRWWGRQGRDLPLDGVDVASLGPEEWELALSFRDGASLAVGKGLPQSALEGIRRLLEERHLRPVPAPVRSALVPPRPAPAPLPGRPGTGITFLPDDAPAPSQGECQVCNGKMTADLVACRRCRTLHHRACWSYARKCSTYGCGGAETSEPETPAPAPATARPGGECQVCNTPMTTDLVACASCRTLHHKACWDYMRRCSTYACRGTRAVAAARAEGEGDVVVIAEEEGPDGRRRAGRKALREWMRTVASEHSWGEVRSRERKHRHCEVSFPVGRLACVLEGRSTSGHLTFRVRAELPDPRLRDRAVSAPIPPRYAWIERRVHADHMELLPRTSIDGLPLLRGFVRGSLEILAAISAPT